MELIYNTPMRVRRLKGLLDGYYDEAGLPKDSSGLELAYSNTLALKKLESIRKFLKHLSGILGGSSSEVVLKLLYEKKLGSKAGETEKIDILPLIYENHSHDEYSYAVEYEKLKTDFISNISHELRTPVHVILSAVQMSKYTLVDDFTETSKEKLEKYTDIMELNCYRLIRLINNIIDVTRVESGELKANLSNNNLVKVVEDIALHTAYLAEKKGIKLVFDTEMREKILSFDRGIFERILLNLLSNAIKFSSSGSIITLKIIGDDNRVFISVGDMGMGIPEEGLESIFEKFEQVDKSLLRPSEGTGLGLFLVKKFVELHNGNVSVKSQLGKGSEFVIELPIVTIEDEPGRFSLEDPSIEQKIKIEFSDIYF